MGKEGAVEEDHTEKEDKVRDRQREIALDMFNKRLGPAPFNFLESTDTPLHTDTPAHLTVSADTRETHQHPDLFFVFAKSLTYFFLNP